MAKRFLKKKTDNDFTEEYVREQVLALRKKTKTTKNGRRQLCYPKFASIDSREVSFLINSLVLKNEILAHDPKRFEVKIEEFVKLYEQMMSENWEEFEKARIERDKQDLKLGEDQLVTFQFNADILTLIMRLIGTIDLTKTNASEIGYDI